MSHAQDTWFRRCGALIKIKIGALLSGFVRLTSVATKMCIKGARPGLRQVATTSSLANKRTSRSFQARKSSVDGIAMRKWPARRAPSQGPEKTVTIKGMKFGRLHRTATRSAKGAFHRYMRICPHDERLRKFSNFVDAMLPRQKKYPFEGMQ